MAKPKHKVPDGAIKTLLAIASPCAFEIEPGIEFAQLSIRGLGIDIAQSAIEALYNFVSPGKKIAREG